MQLDIFRANLHQPEHAAAMLLLLDAYARDPAGGAEGLKDEVKARLPRALADRPGVHVLLAFAEGEPAGLAICMEGYSTFAGAPLLNLHDFAVLPTHRGAGIGRALMTQVVALAEKLECCKVTLEVLEGNAPARALYRDCGFEDYALDPAWGKAMFMQRWIGD
ncbi:GNAT family N-acetyltransferase [Niveibacterium umoris]|uniref:Ribosomal protein S18 acetylase RimI-like enzyme n=1 Tax=Niveibacterium umoris TaxID=1193620 RepID=A0A840BNF8_9RHOO|nr:GNAT family N-acetyltransferase [Niveibacterium umoris]MBB4013202.1 ribosomal protein S18 acetylase RimI-like enzyme [Niveibacterium umoris]